MEIKRYSEGEMEETNGRKVTNEAGKVVDNLKDKQRKEDDRTILETKGRGKKKRQRGRSTVTTKQDDKLKVIRRRKKKPKGEENNAKRIRSQ